MTLADWIAVAVILLIIGGATAYIIKAKKSGKKCIGCPNSNICGKAHSAGCTDGCGGCGHCNNQKSK